MLRLRDIMTANVLSVSPDVTIREVAEIFSTNRIGAAPVLQRGGVIGIVTSSDILDFVASLPAEPPEADEGLSANLLEDHTVEEAMTRTPLHTLPPNASARDAAILMRDEGIHRVLIMEGDALVGLVSSLDLAKAFADGHLYARSSTVLSEAWPT